MDNMCIFGRSDKGFSIVFAPIKPAATQNLR